MHKMKLKTKNKWWTYLKFDGSMIWGQEGAIWVEFGWKRWEKTVKIRRGVDWFLNLCSRPKRRRFGQWWEEANRTTGRLVPQLEHARERHAEGADDSSLRRVVWRWFKARARTTCAHTRTTATQRRTTRSFASNDRRSVVQCPFLQIFIFNFNPFFT